jgi:glycerol-3-phosphate acyltransferase PlsY
MTRGGLLQRAMTACSCEHQSKIARYNKVLWLRILLSIAAILTGYTLGSIPTGYLIGKAWGVDVREHGSGRTGGTNVWRATKQVWPLVLTVSGDVIKGMAAVLIGRYVLGPYAAWSELTAALAGAAAIAGHNWSFMLGLRGGAGGMTAGAALIMLSPTAGVVVAVIAVALLLITHYASVATLTVGLGSLIVLGLLTLLAGNANPWPHLIFGVMAAVGILWALRPNLKRLIQGTERRITF